MLLLFVRIWIAGSILISNNHDVVVHGLPAGFTDETVLPMNQIVDIAFAGTIMLAVTKVGKLYSYDLEDPHAASHLAADFTNRLCINGEHGYVVRLKHPDSQRQSSDRLYNRSVSAFSISA